ncbi:hypothetical protein LJC33_06155 [Eubacteriales bacterium OttesenSCG-928-N13]|nr:hypothetical protein [Eubacteriales bacterium OttesenSCG-928-N13]
MKHTKSLALGMVLALCMVWLPMAYAQEDSAAQSLTDPFAPVEEEPDGTNPEGTADPQPTQAVEHTPVPEGTPDAHQYSACWSDDAFDGQTVNYTGELVMGEGARYQIDRERSIMAYMDGEPCLDAVQIDFDSSDGCLSVDQNGQLRAVKKGSAQLIATVQFPNDTQKQLRKPVKVVDAPMIHFAPDFAVIEDGGQLDLGQYAKNPLLKVSPNVDADVRYQIQAVDQSHGSSVKLNEDNGRLTVRYDQPGDSYRVVATTYAGDEAQFMLYLGRRALSIDILVDPNALNEQNQLSLSAGESRTLKAAVYDGAGEPAARQDVYWQIENAPNGVQIDAQGMLSVHGGLTEATEIVIYAVAQDGSQIYAQISAQILP